MKSLRLSVLTDGFFIFTGSSVIFTVIINYFLSHKASVFLGLTLGALLTLLCIKLLTEKNNKTSVRLRENKLYKNTFLGLALMKENKILDLFYNALKNENSTVKKISHGLLLEESNTVCFFKLGFEPLTKTDVVKAFNRINRTQKALIFSENADKNVLEFINLFDNRITHVNGKQIFETLKKANLLPLTDTPNYILKRKKPRFFAELKNAKASKSFFVLGITFLLMSFIVPIKTYYVIIGSCMTVYALFLKIFGDRTKN